jgi:hypothetical protein
VQRQQQLSALHYSPLEMHFAQGTHVVDQANIIPVSTRWHRAHGCQTRRQRAERQQLLTLQQEKALVDNLLRLHKSGYTAHVKHLRYFTGVLLRQRNAAVSSNWQRHVKNPRVKIEHWFTIMGKQLAKRGILPESVYNVDETGVLLSDLNIVRVLTSRSDV